MVTVITMSMGYRSNLKFRGNIEEELNKFKNASSETLFSDDGRVFRARGFKCSKEEL